MPPAIIAAGVGAVAKVGSGLIASSGAKKAATAQETAAKAAAAAQERAANLALEAQKTGTAEAVAAAREAATAAQEAQDRATQAAQDYARASFEEQRNQFNETFGNAQTAYQSAYDQANKALGQGFEGANQAQTNAYMQQLGLQNPYREAGLTAQQQMMQLLGIGGDTTAANYGRFGGNFNAANFEQDPGYAFRQEEGQRALERSAAARGGLLSGNMLKGVQRFSQGLASQEYQNAFNRYQTERAAQLGQLQPLMGAGQSAANVMTGAAGQYGQNMAQNALGLGQSQAQNALGLGQATAQNQYAQGQANVGNIQNLYGTQSNLALQQGQNTAQNQYNLAQARQQAAMNLANAGSNAAYNIGNAQAGGLTNAAQARASGYVGSANAMAGALSGIGQAVSDFPLYQAQIGYLNRTPNAGTGTGYSANDLAIGPVNRNAFSMPRSGGLYGTYSTPPFAPPGP